MPEAWHQRLAMGDEREMGEKHAVPEQGKATARQLYLMQASNTYTFLIGNYINKVT